jgi:plasmid stability protein
MGEMNIRIEDDLRIRIEELARLHNRSVEEEVESLLRGAVPAVPRREDLQAIARRITAMTPKGVKQTDSVEILREIRGN